MKSHDIAIIVKPRFPARKPRFRLHTCWTPVDDCGRLSLLKASYSEEGYLSGRTSADPIKQVHGGEGGSYIKPPTSCNTGIIYSPNDPIPCLIPWIENLPSLGRREGFEPDASAHCTTCGTIARNLDRSVDLEAAGPDRQSHGPSFCRLLDDGYDHRRSIFRRRVPPVR